MIQKEIQRFAVEVQSCTDAKGNIDYCALSRSSGVETAVDVDMAFKKINEKAKLLPLRAEGYAVKKVACLGSEYAYIPYYVKSICVKRINTGISWLALEYLDTKLFPMEQYAYKIDIEGPVLAEVGKEGFTALFFDELSNDSIPLYNQGEIKRARMEIDAYNALGYDLDE